MELLAVIMTSVFTLLFLLVGFRSGIIYERIKWNKLIEDGRIPKPTTSTKERI